MIKRIVLGYPWVIPVILFSILTILASGMHPLWTDEAETALFAKSIIRECCLPRGWDGVNIMGMDAVYLNHDLVNYSNPPLQYYVTALSFMIFGESDRAARFPFVLFSIGSLVILYSVAYEMTRNRSVALLAVVILSLSVPFILFAYRARYYPLITFSGLLFLLCASRLTKPSRLTMLGFVLASIFFVYSHYIAFAIVYTVFGIVWTAVSSKKRWKAFLRRYIELGAAALALFAPWFLTFKPYELRASPISYASFTEPIKLITLAGIEMAHFFNQNNTFPFLLAPALLLLFFIRPTKPLQKPLISLVAVIGLSFLSSAALYVFVNSETPAIALRHNILLMPLFAIVMAILLVALRRTSEVLFWLLVVLFVGTNIFTLQNFPPLVFLWHLGKEIRHPYQTPSALVAAYLNRYANEGDTVFVNLEQHLEPLIYYTGSRVRFINRVNRNNPRLSSKTFSILPTYVYNFRGEPDWVILFSKRGFDGTPFTIYHRAMPPGIDLPSDYTEAVLPVYFFDRSQPEIEIHAFEEVIPSYRDQVFIYRKKQ